MKPKSGLPMGGLLSLLLARPQRTVLILTIFTCLTSTALSSIPDSLIGQKAPIIYGKEAVSSRLLKLSALMTEIAYAKGQDGKFKEVDGKYVLQVTKNVVILNFFSMSCIPCIREIPTYNQIAERFRNKPVQFIYVNVDADVDSLEIKRFIARRQIKIRMMLPNQKEALKKYNAYRLPRIIIIDRQGITSHIITGFNEDLYEQLTQIIENLLK